jgi:type 1 glutamine amidotransferase
LAAANAELGDFAAAVKWQTLAVERASAGESTEFRARLDLYRRNKPFHQRDVPSVATKSGQQADRPSLDTSSDKKPKKKLLALTESGPAAFPHLVSQRENGKPSIVEKVLQKLANIAGIEVAASQDSRVSITAQSLNEFDAVFFYTRGELPITPEGKAALLEFIRSGNGFAGCHSAADSLSKWPEYAELIGASLGRNLGTKDLTIRLDDLAHPSTRDFDTTFRVHDELYQFKEPFARDKLHVLMHFDRAGVANGGAMSWTKEHGNGRVFYTSLGHDERMWKNDGFQRHLLGGLCDVLRLKLPADPSPSPARLAILNRHAAEAVLSLGGEVVIRNAANEMTIKPGEILPPVAFKLVKVRLADKPALVDSDLERLRGVASIVEVNLRNAKSITDDALARLEGLRRLEVLDLHETRVTDAGLAHFKDSKQLRWIDLSRTQVTDTGLVELSRFPKLESLNLGARRVTGAGLGNLQGLTRLRELYLWDQNVPNASLANLKNLVELETLELVGTPVNDEGLAYLKRLPNLRRLNLYHSGVTGTGFADPQGLYKINRLSLRLTPTNGAGLMHVGKLAQLEWLDLAYTAVTDADLIHLRGLSRLASLDLARTKISSAGLAHLRGLTQLKEINVDGTGVTAPAAEEFRRWLPACRVAGTLAAAKW